MCNVCCANTAIENTTKGSWFQATWSTKRPPRRRGRRPSLLRSVVILNNPSAPPLDAVEVTLADLKAGTEPYLLVQAEGEAEGPGRVRYGFDGETWTTWTATENVASEMLYTDTAWPHVPKDVQDAVRQRDIAGVEMLLFRRALDDLQFEVGRRITAGLPQNAGRAGVQEALREMRARVQREMAGIALTDDGRSVLLDLLTWSPRQPFPRSPRGFRRALRAQRALRDGLSPLCRGLEYGIDSPGVVLVS